MRDPRTWAVTALLAASLLAAGCSRPGQPARHGGSVGGHRLSTEARTTQPDSLVDLTVYLRAGSPQDAYLVPVTRQVAIGDDLPRRALELLLAGPRPDDDEGLSAPVPTSTEVLDVAVHGSTAFADVSAEVITDATSVGGTAENEALAAIADTLTELPTIDQVRLTVEGRASGRVGEVDVGGLWGGWGLPEVLVRDDSVAGELPDADRVPDLRRFRVEPQVVGAEGVVPVEVTGVRTSRRATYLRLTIDLAAGSDRQPSIPRARAWVDGQDILVQIADVVGYGPGLADGGSVRIDDPAAEAVGVEHTDLPGAARLVVRSGAARPFWLHTRTNPSRVVLDISK